MYKKESLVSEVKDEGCGNLLRGAHLYQVDSLLESVTKLDHMLSPACESTMRVHYRDLDVTLPLA